MIRAAIVEKPSSEVHPPTSSDQIEHELSEAIIATNAKIKQVGELYQRLQAAKVQELAEELCEAFASHHTVIPKFKYPDGDQCSVLNGAIGHITSINVSFGDAGDWVMGFGDVLPMRLKDKQGIAWTNEGGDREKLSPV